MPDEPHVATQEEMARITFRIGPRDLRGAVCKTCGKAATYLLARPYDLAPGGEKTETSCAEHAAGYPLWKEGGVGNAFDSPSQPDAQGEEGTP